MVGPLPYEDRTQRSNGSMLRDGMGQESLSITLSTVTICHARELQSPARLFLDDLPCVQRVQLLAAKPQKARINLLVVLAEIGTEGVDAAGSF